ncbi:MAG: hypothetical protein JWL73_1153 [Actinomycetia bacterium]|nr:hypothetical protein [Actinomycetes bacterium]
MPGVRRHVGPLLAVMVLAGALAGCGSSSSTASPSGTSVKTVKPKPAGVNPSKSARMVCGSEANGDIAKAFGVSPARISTPTWIDHVYSCTYEYPDGVATLSVKELDSAAETKAYFEGLATQMGRTSEQLALGQGAFVATNGASVVRKDWKVLVVDVTKLPPKFGKQHLSPTLTGEGIAATVMGCWTGA